MDDWSSGFLAFWRLLSFLVRFPLWASPYGWQPAIDHSVQHLGVCAQHSFGLFFVRRMADFDGGTLTWLPRFPLLLLGFMD
jgi:hypothetical protein